MDFSSMVVGGMVTHLLLIKVCINEPLFSLTVILLTVEVFITNVLVFIGIHHKY